MTSTHLAALGTAVNPDGTPVTGGVTLIQVVLVAAILGVALLLNRTTADSRHQAIRRLLLLGFVIAAVISVAFPSVLSRIAAFVGVGRGTDLLLYALVIAFLSYIATSLRRTRQLTSRITVLARELALAQARIEDGEARLVGAAAQIAGVTSPQDADGAPASPGAQGEPSAEASADDVVGEPHGSRSPGADDDGATGAPGSSPTP